jgi:hypothetical protein
MELLYDRGGNFSKTFLRIQRQQLPGEVQRVIQVSAFILTLCNELMLKLLQELQMVQVLFCERLYEQSNTS